MIVGSTQHLRFGTRQVRSQKLQKYLFEAVMDEPRDLIICAEITPAVRNNPSLQVADRRALQALAREARTVAGEVALQEGNDICTGKRQSFEVIEQDNACCSRSRYACSGRSSGFIGRGCGLLRASG